MDCWERFDETSFPDKEAFRLINSNLSMEYITDVDIGMQKEYSTKLRLKALIIKI